MSSPADGRSLTGRFAVLPLVRTGGWVGELSVDLRVEFFEDADQPGAVPGSIEKLDDLRRHFVSFG